MQEHQRDWVTWKLRGVEKMADQWFAIMRGKQTVTVRRENQVVQCGISWRQRDLRDAAFHPLSPQTVILDANWRLPAEPLVGEVQVFGVLAWQDYLDLQHAGGALRAVSCLWGKGVQLRSIPSHQRAHMPHCG